MNSSYNCKGIGLTVMKNILTIIFCTLIWKVKIWMNKNDL